MFKIGGGRILDLDDIGSQNELEELGPIDSVELAGVERLRSRSNGLSEVQSWIFGLARLRELDLWDSSLTEMQDFPDGLVELNLGRNRLDMIGGAEPDRQFVV